MEEVKDDWLNTINFVIKKMGVQSYRDDLIDVGYIGYAKALKTFKSGKCKFFTWAVLCIESEIGMYLRKLNGCHNKIIYHEISMETVSYSGKDGDISLIDMIPANYDLEADVVKRDLLNLVVEVAKDILNENQYRLFDLYFLKGWKQCEILKEYKYNNISRCVITIKEKIKNDPRIKRINKEVVYE